MTGKIVISTEIWNTKDGEVVKAVVRDANGHFLGATNQTTKVATKKPKAKRKPRFYLMGK